jgi:hypothetical protein
MGSAMDGLKSRFQIDGTTSLKESGVNRARCPEACIFYFPSVNIVRIGIFEMDSALKNKVVYATPQFWRNDAE